MNQPGQRAHPRFALEIDASVHVGERKIPARTRNVSRGGLAVIVPLAIPVGQGVTVSMSLVFESQGSGSAMSEPLPLQGRVVWCSPICTEDGDGFQLGVMFVGIRHEERSYVDMFLRYLKQ